MLEGPTEQRVLKAGQWLADQFAYRRINRRFARFTRSYIKHHQVRFGQIADATFKAAKEALLVRRRLRGFTTLRFYVLVLGDLPPGLIDETEYWRDLHRDWGGQSRVASDVKTLTRKSLNSNQIPDLGYYVNKNWFNLDWRVSSRAEIVAGLEHSDQIVIKADYSERGKAVRMMTKAQFLDPKFMIKENSVLQRKIEQHPMFDIIHPGEDATVRLVTSFWQGSSGPELLSGLVKWGVLTTDDDSHRLKIDIRTGNFEGQMVRADWKKFPLPPQLEMGIHALPGFKDAVALVLKLHASFPHFQLIGWDLGIDADSRPWIFEWNANHPAIFTAQAMNGPVFAEGKQRSRSVSN